MAAQAKPLVQAPAAVEATTAPELKKQTYDFVKTFAAATPRLDKLARWNSPICVAVEGLVPAQAQQVKARLEEVAKALKVAVAKPGCNASLEVFFLDNPQSLLDRVAATREDLLGYWHHRDHDSLKMVTQPIQAWYVTATSGAGGNTGMGFAYLDRTDSSTENIGKQSNGEVIDDPDVHPPTGCGETRFANCMKSTFNHVMIVVDNGAVRDYSPGLIADYVTMLAFAQPQLPLTCKSLASVTDLFACQRPEPVRGLTRTDVAYLTSLYRTDLEAFKVGQESNIANGMADMLLKANKADNLALQARSGEPAANAAKR